MSGGVLAGPSSSAAELDAMWRGQLVWWHGGFAAVVGLTAACAWFDGMRGERLAVALVCLAALGGVYAVIGVRGMSHVEEGWEGRAFVLAASVIFLIVLAVTGSGVGWLLAFAIFPQMWALLSVREAAPLMVLVILGAGVVEWSQSPQDRSSLVEIVLSCGISLALSLLLGFFINNVIDEASARADTIDELRATQAELAESERARGVYAERERLGHEIHDTLAQGFTSVVTLSRVGRAAVQRGDFEEAQRVLGMLEQTGGENLREARLLVAEMSPGHLQSRTLPEALERVTRAVQVQGTLRVRLEVDGQPRALPTATDVVLLRTAQEALANVRRHARAGSVVVRLSYGEQVTLSVRDDGIGFDAHHSRAGYGLDGVLERARRVGGSATVDSTPGVGSTVIVAVPA